MGFGEGYSSAPNIPLLSVRLTERGFQHHYFDTGAQAVDWLDRELDNQSIGFGGSETLHELGLYQRLRQHNQVYWHWECEEDRRPAFSAQVFLTSANGIAESGEIVNIDAGGNRVAATIFGPQRLIFVVGINKIVPDLAAAIYRARNIAAPQNCIRLHRNTPCTSSPGLCRDCRSPDRLCQVMTIHYGKPLCIPKAEVLIIGTPLGF